MPATFRHFLNINFAVYSQIESTNKIEEIEHPFARATLNFLKLQRGIEIHHDYDCPHVAGWEVVPRSL